MVIVQLGRIVRLGGRSTRQAAAHDEGFGPRLGLVGLGELLHLHVRGLLVRARLLTTREHSWLLLHKLFKVISRLLSLGRVTAKLDLVRGARLRAAYAYAIHILDERALLALCLRLELLAHSDTKA